MSRNTDTYRLWQHRNGIFYVQWSDRTETVSGPYWGTKRVSTGTTDRRAAEEYRAQFIAGLSNQPPPAEPTIGYLLERYLTERGPHVRAPEAIANAIKVLQPFFGNLLPVHVTHLLLRQFAQEHQSKSPSTTLRRLSVLKAALRYAEGNRWIAPLPPLRMPVSPAPPRQTWLTRAEVAKLIGSAQSPHVRLFVQLAIATAARTGAILDLQWAQIDFERRIINFGKGWGNKRRAIVPFNDDLAAALCEARELAQSAHVIEYNGKPILNIRKTFVRLCQEHGIKASPHTLRHTAATWLVMDGVPLREVARLLGNSEAMVEKVYGKHSPDYLRRAVDVLRLPEPITVTPETVPAITYSPKPLAGMVELMRIELTTSSLRMRKKPTQSDS